MLADAVLEIADQLEAESKESDEHYRTILRGFSRQLRSTVKAAGGKPQLSLGTEDEALKLALRETVAGHKRVADVAESMDTMVEYVDDDGIPSYTSIDPKMPVGAYLKIDGRAYKLTDVAGKRILVFDAVQTERMKGKTL